MFKYQICSWFKAVHLRHFPITFLIICFRLASSIGTGLAMPAQGQAITLAMAPRAMAMAPHGQAMRQDTVCSILENPGHLGHNRDTML